MARQMACDATQSAHSEILFHWPQTKSRCFKTKFNKTMSDWKVISYLRILVIVNFWQSWDA